MWLAPSRFYAPLWDCRKAAKKSCTRPGLEIADRQPHRAIQGPAPRVADDPADVRSVEPLRRGLYSAGSGSL
jgi:hypothetical protein